MVRYGRYIAVEEWTFNFFFLALTSSKFSSFWISIFLQFYIYNTNILKIQIQEFRVSISWIQKVLLPDFYEINFL